MVAIAGATAAAADTGAAPATVTPVSVKPADALFGSGEPVRIVFRVSGSEPAGVVVTIRHRGRAVIRIRRRGLAPGPHSVVWFGRRPSGAIAHGGSYVVWVRAGGGAPRRAGTFRLRHHAFPVDGPHGVRPSLGNYGDVRSGGRRHEGFDITGRCGTPLVAARAGRVLSRGYDRKLYGNHLTIKGRGEPRTYFYSHLAKPTPVKRGQVVRTAEFVGRIGQTGNAGSTPCHLHFELRKRGRPVDPLPHLRRWDRWS